MKILRYDYVIRTADPGPRLNSRQSDACLLYASEQYSFVRQVADELSSHDMQIFFDKYEIAATWGRNLYQHLSQVYGEEARYCVVFVSVDYARKVFTKLELQSALARALNENNEYVLPVRGRASAPSHLAGAVAAPAAPRSLRQFRDVAARSVGRLQLRQRSAPQSVRCARQGHRRQGVMGF